MPLTRDQWRATISDVMGKLNSAQQYLDAAETGISSPIGISDGDQRFQAPTDPAVVVALKSTFTQLITESSDTLKAGLR